MDLTPIFQAGILLVAALITTFLVPYIISKTTQQQRETISYLAQTAVAALEQTIKGTKMGSEKYAKAIQYFKDRGYNLDVAEIRQQIDMEIEKQVYLLVNQSTVVTPVITDEIKVE